MIQRAAAKRLCSSLDANQQALQCKEQEPLARKRASKRQKETSAQCMRTQTQLPDQTKHRLRRRAHGHGGRRVD